MTVNKYSEIGMGLSSGSKPEEEEEDEEGFDFLSHMTYHAFEVVGHA